MLYRQPQYAGQQINWANPFAKRLAHHWLTIGNFPLRDIAGNTTALAGPGATLPTGTFIVPGAEGLELLFDNTGVGSIDSVAMALGNSSGSGGPSGTRWTFFCKINLSSIGSGAIQTIYAGNTGSIQIRINASGKIEVNKTNTAAMGTSTTTLAANTWYSICVTYDGSTVRFYLNGKADGTGSSSQTFNHASQYWFGKNGGNAEYLALNGPARMRAPTVWDGALTAAEVAAFTANPYQLVINPMDQLTFASATAADSGVGSSAGTSTANAVSNSNFNGVGSSTGGSTVSAVSAALFAAIASALGTSSASATSNANFSTVGNASSVSTALGVANSLAGGVGTSSGTSSADGVSGLTGSGVGTAIGTSTTTAVSNANFSSVGSSAGTSVAPATGGAIFSTVATAIGTSSALAFSGSGSSGVGSSVGTSTTNGVTTAIAAANGLAIGDSTALAFSGGIVQAVGLAVGTSNALAVGRATGSNVGPSQRKIFVPVTPYALTVPMSPNKIYVN